MKLKTITIIFEGEDGEMIHGKAKDVLNAEGELQRLARAWNRMEQAFIEEGEETPQTVDAVVGVGDEKEKIA